MPDIFDGVLDSLGQGLVDSQAEAMAAGLVKTGLLDPADLPAAKAGILLAVKAFFRNLAKGQT